MDFGKRDMQLFRKRMLSEIVNRELYVAKDHEVVVLSDSDADGDGDDDVEMQDALLAGTQTPPVDDSIPQADPPVRSASAETVAPPGPLEEQAMLLLQEQINLANAYNKLILNIHGPELLAEWREKLEVAVAAFEVRDTKQRILTALRDLNEKVRKEYDKTLSTAFPPVGSRARRGVDKQLVYDKKQLASKKRDK